MEHWELLVGFSCSFVGPRKSLRVRAWHSLVGASPHGVPGDPHSLWRQMGVQVGGGIWPHGKSHGVDCGLEELRVASLRWLRVGFYPLSPPRSLDPSAPRISGPAALNQAHYAFWGTEV